jgi:hypothetical protein
MMSSLAWISTSEACPARPPTLGWCRSIRVFGSAFLLPLAPAASRNAPIEAAIPRAVVTMSGLTN